MALWNSMSASAEDFRSLAAVEREHGGLDRGEVLTVAPGRGQTRGLDLNSRAQLKQTAHQRTVA